MLLLKMASVVEKCMFVLKDDGSLKTRQVFLSQDLGT